MPLAITDVSAIPGPASHPRTAFATAVDVSVKVFSRGVYALAGNQAAFPGLGFSKCPLVNDGADRARLTQATSKATAIAQLAGALRTSVDDAVSPSLDLTSDDVCLKMLGLPLAADWPATLGGLSAGRRALAARRSRLYGMR